MSTTQAYRPPETVDAVPAREGRRGSLQRVLARLDAAYAAEGLTMAQKAVLVALVRHADDLGECHPQTDTLAVLCSTTTRTVCRSLDELEALGYFTRERVTDAGGHRRGYRYTLSAVRLGLVADRTPCPVSEAPLSGQGVLSATPAEPTPCPVTKGGSGGVGLGQNPPPPVADAVAEHVEEEAPAAGDTAAAVLEALRPHQLLAGHVAPLRVAIAGAIDRGADPGRLQAALAAKLREARSLGLLVALARSAEAADYPAARAYEQDRTRGEVVIGADVARHHASPGRARHLRATEEARRIGAEFCYLAGDEASS